MSDELLSTTQLGPTPEEVSTHRFSTVRRGLDPDAVYLYLAEVAGALRALRAREAALRVEQERTVVPPPPPPPMPLDPAALSAAVGQETARVLQVAHEAADQLLENAQVRADELTNEAVGIVDAERRRAEETAAAILADANEAAAEAEAQTTEQCRQMVEAARAARHRILADLVARRHQLHVQLEQLRAGKDALGDVVDAVAAYIVHSVDELKADLAGAEERARQAAATAGESAALLAGEVSEDELLREADAIAGLSGEATTPATAGSGPAPLAAPRWETSAGEVAETARSASAVNGPPSESIVAEENTAAGANPIDELFAKIRQSRVEQVERARNVLDEQPPETGGFVAVESSADVLVTSIEIDVIEVAATPSEAEPETMSETTTEADDEPLGDAVDATEAEAPEADGASRAAEETEIPAQSEEEASEELAAESESAEARSLYRAAASERDAMLTASIAELGRVIKRQLLLEQNELLDGFRHQRREVDPTTLMPGEEMASRLARSANEPITVAFAAGERFAHQSLEHAEELSPPADEHIEPIATALGSAIVETIRRRLELGLVNGDEEPSVAIGAAFREWKGAAAEQTAADYAIRAFSAGVVDAAETLGALVTWLVDDSEGRCPDCDDNAIAGALAPGEAFPTGHEYPPIHPGCRCMLVPSFG